MKKLMKLTTLAALAFAGAASAAIAEGDCKAGSYGAGITVKYADGKCVADIDADGDNRNDPLSIPSDKTVIVDSVHYDRSSSKTGKAQTVAFPFAVSKSCTVTGANFYEFDGNKNKIYLNSQSSGSKWVALLQNKKSLSTDGLTAYYPYVIEFTTKNSLFIDIGGCSMVFVAPSAANYSFAAPGLNGTWSLFSSVSRIEWAEGHEDLGFIYGFAGKQVGEADVGNFVKAAAGASVPPLRAYLKFVPSQNASQSRVLMKAAAEESEVALPEEIEVQFVSLLNAEEVSFPEGECFTDSITDGELTPGYKSVEFKTTTSKSGEKMRTACIDAVSRARFQSISIPEEVEVDSVSYNRRFQKEKNQTIVFPFDGNNNIYGANVWQFKRIYKYWEGGDWIVDAGQLDGGIVANTPYIVSSQIDQLNPDSTLILTKNRGGSVFKMKTSLDNLVSIIPSDSTGAYSTKWQFRGTYEYKKWDAENNASELGRVYGLASKNIDKVSGGDSIKVGQFVKGAEGVSITPMHAYLYYNRVPVAAKSAAGSDDESLSDEDLPETITVRFLDADGKVMSIGQMNTYTGEVKMNKDLWFDLKGRQFNKKPTIKGTYYNQGRKVIIK